MMKNLALLLIILINLKQINAQQFGTLKDARDGKVYKTVKIGQQEWMAENLNTDRFRNGDIIPEAKSDREWIDACFNEKPIWCYYNFNPKYGETYGRLYNGYAVIDPRGIAPEGFKVGSTKDWEKLHKYLGVDAGSKLKSKNGFISKSKNDNIIRIKGTNSSGFTGIPGGSVSGFGSKIEFSGLGDDCQWWTSSEQDGIETYLHIYSLGIANSWLHLSSGHKVNGLYIRCIKSDFK
jgi:uncharacterized protein (TIGR02145 family)